MCISLIHFSFIISFLPLLRALTPIIHPTLTYLLLEVTTRVLLLYNSMNSAFGGGNGGSNPIHATITTANETYQLSQPIVESIVDDSLITGILDKAPHEDNQSTDEMYYTSTSVIQKLRKRVGLEQYQALEITNKDVQDQVDDILDSLFWDENKKKVMISVTVQGGDVDQIPFEEN